MENTLKNYEHCMDESTLICKTQNGSLDSFNQIVLTYQEFVFNTALYILGDDELAADATQESFLLAFRNINKYQGGSFKAWIIRIVTNVCFDELRRQKRRPTLPLELINDDDEEIETPYWMADTGLSPEKRNEMSELAHVIRYCLDALPIDFRAVVVLIDLQGMDYNQAANAIHVPLGTIKSRLARARQRLRAHLREFREILPSVYLCDKMVCNDLLAL